MESEPVLQEQIQKIFWKIDPQDEEWLELESYLNNVINARKEDRDDQINDFQIKYNLDLDLIGKLKGINLDQKLSFIKLKTILRKFIPLFSILPDTNNNFFSGLQ